MAKRTTDQIINELELFCAENGRFPHQHAKNKDERSLAYAVSNNKYRQRFDYYQLSVIETLQRGEKRDMKRGLDKKLGKLRAFCEANGRWPNRTVKDESENKLYVTTRRKYFESDPDLLKVYDALRAQYTQQEDTLQTGLTSLFCDSGLSKEEFVRRVTEILNNL